MDHREEEEVASTDNIPVKKVPFLAQNYLKTQKKEERASPEPDQDSINRFPCQHCPKGFKSKRALAGHLQVHSPKTHAKSKSESIPHIKLERDGSPQDQGVLKFDRLVRRESFSSMVSEIQHMTTTWIESTASDHNMDLLNVEVNVSWCQTDKKGFKRTAGDDDIIFDAVPLRAQTQTRKKKKKKTGEASTSMGYQGTSMEGAAKSQITVEKEKAAKRVHQCEICNKTFEKGQALGGHKTKHRVKNPVKVELLPEEDIHLSAQADHQNQTKMKKMLDFDLNMPVNLFNN